MAKLDYPRFADTALRLLDRAGQTYTLRRETSEVPPGAIDPGPVTVSEYQITAVVLPSSAGRIVSFDDRVERGTLVDSNARFVIAAAKGLAIEPQPGDLVEFEDSLWNVTGCTPISPGGLPIVYRMGVSRVGAAE